MGLLGAVGLQPPSSAAEQCVPGECCNGSAPLLSRGQRSPKATRLWPRCPEPRGWGGLAVHHDGLQDARSRSKSSLSLSRDGLCRMEGLEALVCPL